MSRTYLQLCQDIVSDLGIAGGTLGSVAGFLNQEQQRIVGWVARADLFVQQLWTDWKFLWMQDNGITGVAGQDFLTPVLPTNASSIARHDLRSLYSNPGTNIAQGVTWMDWEKFYRVYQVRQKQAQQYPSSFSIDPSGKIWLSSILTANVTFGMQYWMFGKRLAADGDVSLVPTSFDNIICERAKIMYASRENAQEIMVGASAEYTDLLDKMQAFYLPTNLAGRTSRNDRTTIPQSYVE